MIFWILLFTSLTVAISAVFWFFYRRVTVFQKYGVLHRKPYPIFGNMLEPLLRKANIVDYVQEIYDLDKNAKYVGFYNFDTPVFVIRDEELLKSIAIKNFDHFIDHRGFELVNEPIFNRNLFSLRGEKWRKTRNIVSPAFTSNKMKSMFQSISNCAEEYAIYIEENLTNKDMIDTKDTFTRFTVDVIALYAFGFQINSAKEPNNTFYRLGRDAMGFGTFRFLLHGMFQRLFPSLFKLLGLRLFSEEKVRFFQSIIENSIKERREKKIYRPDMIQLMLESQGNNDGMEMTIEDMTAQAFAFFLGGFDTTSNLMCMMALLLAVHPEVQEELHREIDRLLEKHRGALQYEHLQEFTYLEAVIQEVNRLHPPGPFLDRLCVKDFELPPALPGGEPVMMKKDMCAWFPLFALHRDPRFFENPQKFDPQRFVAMNANKNVPSVYVPFGIGPRVCIGTRFALMEIKLLMIHILSRCEFVPSSKTQYPFKMVTKGFSFVPVNGFYLGIRSRREKSKSN